MASSHTVLVAGAGIGGLVAALSMAQRGFRVAVFESALRLEETGARLQVFPTGPGHPGRLAREAAVAPARRYSGRAQGHECAQRARACPRSARGFRGATLWRTILAHPPR